jgi:hypothetical protein
LFREETRLARISVPGTNVLIAKLIRIVPPFLNRNIQESILTQTVINKKTLIGFRCAMYFADTLAMLRDVTQDLHCWQCPGNIDPPEGY